MADKKISELASLTNEDVETNDLIHIVDTSVTENKSITINELDERYYSPKGVTSFTPSLSAGTATFANESGLYWRVQNFMHGTVGFDVTAAGSAALTFSIPESKVIDTSYIARTGSESTADVVGSGKWFDSGSQYRPMVSIYYSNTELRFAYDGSAVVGSALANGDKISFNFRVAIVGW